MAVLTDRAEVSRLEVVETGRRRRWTEDEKLRIVTESLSGPRQVAATARRYGLSRSLLHCGLLSTDALGRCAAGRRGEPEAASAGA
jgi:transposase-like protein